MSKPSISGSDAAGTSSLQVDRIVLPSNAQRLVEALLREGKVEPLVNALRRLESEELRALLTRLRGALVDAAFPAVDRPDAEAAAVSLGAQPGLTQGDPATKVPVDPSPRDALPVPTIVLEEVDLSPKDARPVPSIAVEAVDPSPPDPPPTPSITPKEVDPSLTDARPGLSIAVEAVDPSLPDARPGPSVAVDAVDPLRADARPVPSIVLKEVDPSPTNARPVTSIAVEAIDPSPPDARPSPSIAPKEVDPSVTDAPPGPSTAVEAVDPSSANTRPVPSIAVKETTSTKLKSPKSRRGRALFAVNFVIAIALATLLVTSVGVPSLDSRNEEFDVLEAVAKTAPSANGLTKTPSATEGTQLPETVAEKDRISVATIPSSPLPLTAVPPGPENVEQKSTPAGVSVNTVEPRSSGSAPLAASSYSSREVELLVDRGDQLFRTGDIVAARLFYQRAAAEGSIVAAVRAAETFDPLFLAMLGAKGIRPDPRQALSWYRKASEAGNPEAARRVVSLLAEYPE